MNDMPASDALIIRQASVADWPGIWAVFEPIVREGETYPLNTGLDEAGARAYWFAPDKTIFVAEDPVQGIDRPRRPCLQCRLYRASGSARSRRRPGTLPPFDRGSARTRLSGDAV